MKVISNPLFDAPNDLLKAVYGIAERLATLPVLPDQPEYVSVARNLLALRSMQPEARRTRSYLERRLVRLLFRSIAQTEHQVRLGSGAVRKAPPRGGA